MSVEEISLFELAGRVANNESYGRYYDDNFGRSGAPVGYDLEKIFNSPQEYINDIYHLSRYHYAKVGIIMRVINIIRDFAITDFDLDYPTDNEQVKKTIEAYNERVNIMQVLRDMVFELALTGNLAGYDRDGKRIDIYPITKVQVTPLIINNNPVLIFLNDVSFLDMGQLALNDPNIIRKLALSYPKEIAKGIKDGAVQITLNVENSFFHKVNSSRYERYGMPFILTAFDELAHKNILKQAERSTAVSIIDKILRISVGDKDHKPKQPEIDYYSGLFDNKKGSLKVTVPHFVNVEWIEPSTDIFAHEKFIQVDQDILNALGVSLTLIRGEGGGNYSEGFISLSGLIKTIENVRSGIPTIIKNLYAKELKRRKINPELAPSFRLHDVVIDNTTKNELIQWMFQNAGLPYEILYKESGYDYTSVKLIREKENKQKEEETFKLRSQPFQGGGGGLPNNTANAPNNPKGGAPTKPLSQRKSDKAQSNNNQPRPSK